MKRYLVLATITLSCIGITLMLLNIYLSRVSDTQAILSLLKMKPSERSQDYINNQKQFQLHSLITEQRHPKTLDLSSIIKKNTKEGLKQILSVDTDISKKIFELSQNTVQLDQAVKTIEKAVLQNKKIYVFGCGASGRLAIQLESSFWRPFWQKIKLNPAWEKLKDSLGNTYIENMLIGRITGGDRALISSLEGFEDLQLIGELQLKDENIQKGDVIFAITEGGETSSVIGAILAAQKQYGEFVTPELIKAAKEQLYFVYNNPDEVLLPFDRSRTVLENKAITKISLFTGPQAIAGSTRMQASTIASFVMGMVLEQVIHNVLKQRLTQEEMVLLGFTKDISLSERLLSFIPIQEAVYQNIDAIGQLTDLEYFTYANNHFATYFAGAALVSIFTDATERSPTFALYPLDTINETKRKSWIKILTPADNLALAWESFLGRSFKGLKAEHYQHEFLTKITDPYLKSSALKSLKNAGNDQQFLYDFSYTDSNSEKYAPIEGDFGLIALLAEESSKLTKDKSIFNNWIKLFTDKHAKTAIVLLTPNQFENQKLQSIKELMPETLMVNLSLDSSFDPLKVRQHVILKMIMNAHSTAVMAKLGRVVGNTMTDVRPGNLKLVGRATYLIQAHVNEAIAKAKWRKNLNDISYVDANAVLFDAINYLNQNKASVQSSVVALAIIRILESLKTGSSITWQDAENIFRNQGVEGYLNALNVLKNLEVK